MSTITTRVDGASRFPWRTVGARRAPRPRPRGRRRVIVGSRAEPLPAPFGPAAQRPDRLLGRMATSSSIDTPGATPRTIIGGPTIDSGRGSRPTARSSSFVRSRTTGRSGELWVADADGSDASAARRTVRDASVGSTGRRPATPSPSRRRTTDEPSITIVATDGSRLHDQLDLGLAVGCAVFRPRDGRPARCSAARPRTARWGLYLVEPRRLEPAAPRPRSGFAPTTTTPEQRLLLRRPAWSPDGGRLMYYTLEPDPTRRQGPGSGSTSPTSRRAGAVIARPDARVRSARPTTNSRRVAADGRRDRLPAHRRARPSAVRGRPVAPAPSPRDLGRDRHRRRSDRVVSPDGRQAPARPCRRPARSGRTRASTSGRSSTTRVRRASDDFAWQRTAPVT